MPPAWAIRTIETCLKRRRQELIFSLDVFERATPAMRGTNMLRRAKRHLHVTTESVALRKVI
jgi:hypothetical protein